MNIFGLSVSFEIFCKNESTKQVLRKEHGSVTTLPFQEFMTHRSANEQTNITNGHNGS